MFCHKMPHGNLIVHLLLLLHLKVISVFGFHFSLPHLFHHHTNTPTIKLPDDPDTGHPQLPISSSTFYLPSPLPNFPKDSSGGGGFATGEINLGTGLNVTQITSFKKIWSSYEGGPGNLGVSLFLPSGIPQGYAMLGSYAQSNHKPLSGWILVGKDYNSTPSTNTNSSALVNPVDYTLFWSSQSLKVKQDNPVFIWTPIPPTGYKAVGHFVTTSPEKPKLDSIKCVRSDLTEQCQTNEILWENKGDKGVKLFSSKPVNVSVNSTAVNLGVFIAQQTGSAGGGSGSSPATENNGISSCLKNSNPNSTTAAMPNMQQLETLIKTYSPIIHLHPSEEYQPSSVNWYFKSGAMLYTHGNESNPIKILPNGTNLPQGGNNDGTYWINFTNETVKRGDVKTSIVYLHIKPMLGGTVTDIAIWLFYPFNGPARLKFEMMESISLGKVGEHVGDWEHVTLRISNFDGGLRQVYFSQHSNGEWIGLTDLEFENETSNRVVVYASLHGHAMHAREGTVIHGGNGGGGVGVRDDVAKGGVVLDVVKNGWEVITGGVEVKEPMWVEYMRAWGPKVNYDIAEEIGKASKLLPGLMKKGVEKAVQSLPREMLGEEGPTGPKVKGSWFGDEKI